MDFIRDENTPYFSLHDSGPLSYRVFQETAPWNVEIANGNLELFPARAPLPPSNFENIISRGNYFMTSKLPQFKEDFNSAKHDLRQHQRPAQGLGWTERKGLKF